MNQETDAIKPIDKLLEQINVDTIFGNPITQGDTTVIPVAEIHIGFGYGWGKCKGAEIKTDDNGAGGGAGVKASPKGFILISPDYVKYKKIHSDRWITILLSGIAGIVAGFIIGKIMTKNKGINKIGKRIK